MPSWSRRKCDDGRSEVLRAEGSGDVVDALDDIGYEDTSKVDSFVNVVRGCVRRMSKARAYRQ